MNAGIRYTAIVLLSVMFSIILERAVPHTHNKCDGLVIPELPLEHSDIPFEQDSEKGDTLHSSVYKKPIFNYRFFEELIIVELLYNIINFGLEEQYGSELFNMSPKVLSMKNLIIGVYCSKSPPNY